MTTNAANWQLLETIHAECFGKEPEPEPEPDISMLPGEQTIRAVALKIMKQRHIKYRSAIGRIYDDPTMEVRRPRFDVVYVRKIGRRTHTAAM